MSASSVPFVGSLVLSAFCATRMCSSGPANRADSSAGILNMMTPRHGHWARGKRTGTYLSWAAMKARCYCPSTTDYAKYGGRGVVVCERWMDFENFLADMGERPAGTSIDRHPNKYGNYEPGNCRWATRKQQQRNLRSNTLIEFNGETLCIAEWAERLGMSQSTLYCRLIKHRWPLERAMTTPVGRYSR